MNDALGTDATVDAPDAAVPAADLRSRSSLVRGASVGRYVVLSELGAGGMGVVFAAYDPDLDRKVALKLLRAGLGAEGSDGAARLLREAQALAKVSHPNVVAIHDVGTRGDEVWIAMEFIAGRTLGDWLREGSRSWQQVLDVIEPVVRGLATAHAAGLVHRDVKPDNVMLGDDGRVRVMDFGLARGTAAEGIETNRDELDEEVVRAAGRRIDDALTAAGAMPGTPAYMSPEQFAAMPTDARTDQFSLCVMLHEAIYGKRPFAGDTVVELATNVLEGNRRSIPASSKVPRWLRGVVERGLATDPNHRWPSLPAMLAAMGAGRRRARRGRVLMGLGVLGSVVGVGLGARAWVEHRRVVACEAEGGLIEQVWNEDVRAEVVAGLVETGTGHAATTAEKVMPWLDEQAAAWRAARTQVCVDARVRRVLDEQTERRSVWCL